MKLPRGSKNWPHKVCLQCGVTFGPKRGHGTREWRSVVYCSRACSAKSRSVPLTDRLLMNSAIDAATGCVEWIAYRNRKGYGYIGRNPFTSEVMVHRVAWFLNVGEIPKGLHVLHKCDNPRCINVDHLFLGTNADNVADRVAKGRNQPCRGEKNGRAKLNPDQVRAIRSDTRIGKIIAPEYGVSLSAINRIRSGEGWRSLT